MNKKTLSSVAAAAVLGLSMTALPACAYTADDVAAKARAAGWPEYLIQAGYNQWASGSYSQEKLDAAYNAVSTYSDDMEERICDYLGIIPDDEEEEVLPTGTGGSTDPVIMQLTKTDGTVIDRIAPADFIKLTLEEKRAYVDSLAPESKTAFVNSLSKEERNSMIKQLPASDKADILQSCINAAGEMGLNVSVDSVDGGNISMTIRDEDGIVVDKAAVGVIIDETGISHTRPLAVALGGLLAAAAGFGGLYYYIRKTEE